MWISARERLPGLGQLALMWAGYGEPMVARLNIVADATGAGITVWENEVGYRRPLNEGQFWIPIPELPSL